MDTFINVYENAHTSREAQIDRLIKGQNKLEEAERDTEIMEKELIVKRGELEEKGKDLEKLLSLIRKDTTIAERKKGEVEAVRRRLIEEAAELKSQVDHIEHELADAMPVLNEATEALDAITSNDISNLRTMRQPPVLIKRIMDAVLILRRKPMQAQSDLYAMQGKHFDPEMNEMEPCWAEAKTMMATSGFLRSLTNYDPQMINAETIDLLEPYLARSDFTFEAAKRSSGNIAGVVPGYVLWLDTTTLQRWCCR